MLETATIAALALLLPLTAVITYFDVRYRRIPNVFVLATLISGLIINFMAGGFDGLMASAGGCLMAFVLMFVLHVFGAMGAGDVKLFAAVGSVVGTQLVPSTFLVVLLTGGVLAVYNILRNGTVLTTLSRVLQIFVGLLPGWQMPRFEVPSDRRHTLPYGVAITLGSLISLFVFRA
ncbi:MAG: prepilin peptidase CpaA [Acidobacteriota bacterium]|jgi:prepilin peptidase CpaA|nr:prepilin peptidase CpaA [Acidobacteriota bacterium]